MRTGYSFFCVRQAKKSGPYSAKSGGGCSFFGAKTTYIQRNELDSQLQELLAEIKSNSGSKIPQVSNINYWFSSKTQHLLADILSSIRNIANDSSRVFFEVCFSNLIKKVSYADPRISVPVKLNPERFVNDPATHNKIKAKLEALSNVDVLGRFEQICNENISRLSLLADATLLDCKASVISDDARVLTKSLSDDSLLEDQSVDLVLTSPPYAGAQKYIRSSSLNLSWLGITSPNEMRKLDGKNIGRENYYKAEITNVKTGIQSADDLLKKLFEDGKQERSYIVGNYINEMKDAIDESMRVLKDNGYFIMIIGNNTVCGHEFNTQEYLSKYMESIGLTPQFKLIDDIKSYGLMTKRNKTADRISCEWILVFRKSLNG